MLKYNNVNLLEKRTYENSSKEVDYREYVLGKIYPNIRYGRDIDLERYITMRENGKKSNEWERFYQKLSNRYTEQERKKLIRSYRKNMNYFELLFTSILQTLYTRILHQLHRRIDILVTEYEKIQSKAGSRGEKYDIISRIEYMVSLCASSRNLASEGMDFLLEIAESTHYKYTELKKAEHIIKGYLDGSLFDRVEVKQEYHFDIREEYKKQKKKALNKETDFKLTIRLTEEDISCICVEQEGLNEYELSLEYMGKYFKLIGNQDFAVKTYIYSKKFNTDHFRIYDAIRKGCLYNFQKNRIFDDIFKIICGGKYIFNITDEKQIALKLRTLGQPEREREKPAGRRKSGKSRILPEQQKTSVVTSGQKPLKKKKKILKTKKKSSVTPVRQKIRPSFLEGSDRRDIHSVLVTMKNLSPRKRTQRMLIKAFEQKLSEGIAQEFGYKNGIPLQNESEIANLKELTSYVLSHYEKILCEKGKLLVHKEYIENLGYSLHTVDSLILNCSNEVKSAYLSGTFNFKTRKSLFGRSNFF